MFFPLVLVMAVFAFVLQLLLCRKGQQLLVKLLPLLLIAVGELVCWGVVLLEQFRTLPYGASFSAYICGMMLLVFLGSVLLAWAVWAIIHIIQNKRK